MSRGEKDEHSGAIIFRKTEEEKRMDSLEKRCSELELKYSKLEELFTRYLNK